MLMMRHHHRNPFDQVLAGRSVLSTPRDRRVRQHYNLAASHTFVQDVYLHLILQFRSMDSSPHDPGMGRRLTFVVGHGKVLVAAPIERTMFDGFTGSCNFGG